MPQCAWKIRFAVRTPRVTGARLRMNGRIATDGFSRGNGLAFMPVTTEGMKQFQRHGKSQGVSGAVQGAVITSGSFSYLNLLATNHMLMRYAKAWVVRVTHLGVWRREGALEYQTHATIPLFLTINCADDRNALYQMGGSAPAPGGTRQ